MHKDCIREESVTCAGGGMFRGGRIFCARGLGWSLILRRRSGGSDVSRDICQRCFVAKMCKGAQNCGVNTFDSDNGGPFVLLRVAGAESAPNLASA